MRPLGVLAAVEEKDTMSEDILPARTSRVSARRAHLRPVPSKEPSPGRLPGRHGQLRLPVRVGDRLPWPPEPEPPVLPPPPSEDDLNTLLAALVEVAAGRRPLDSLRGKLSGGLLSHLRRRPLTPPPGRRFVVQSLHIDDMRPHVLEICATVEALPHSRRFAVAGRLEGYWHGWPMTAFGVVLPEQPAVVRAA